MTGEGGEQREHLARFAMHAQHRAGDGGAQLHPLQRGACHAHRRIGGGKLVARLGHVLAPVHVLHQLQLLRGGHVFLPRHVHVALCPFEVFARDGVLLPQALPAGGLVAVLFVDLEGPAFLRQRLALLFGARPVGELLELHAGGLRVGLCLFKLGLLHAVAQPCEGLPLLDLVALGHEHRVDDAAGLEAQHEFLGDGFDDAGGHDPALCPLLHGRRGRGARHEVGQGGLCRT